MRARTPSRGGCRAWKTALLVGIAGALVGAAFAAESILEGKPFRGRDLFEAKGCASCHSVWGHGGSLGPDIAVAVQGKTFFELVGDFWNHTPRMIEVVSEQGYEWPSMTPPEMADALSYLYYLQLFDKPGDPARGRATFSRLRCVDCHSLAGQGGPSGGPLDHFSLYPSPAQLAQAMWNSGARMREVQLRRGSVIPQFAGSDMADLQAYIRSEGLRRGRQVLLQPPPDPERGAETYRLKGCGKCHDKASNIAPDLQQSALSRTASEIAGVLWNHSYAMGEEMSSQGIPFPRFQGTELSDLIAHLYFLSYSEADGDPRLGAEVFNARGCRECHSGSVEGVPDLTVGGPAGGRVGLAAAMWNHAPQMHELMAERAPFWPKFEPGEMRDLAAFLLQRVPTPD